MSAIEYANASHNGAFPSRWGPVPRDEATRHAWIAANVARELPGVRRREAGRDAARRARRLIETRPAP